MHLLVLSAFRLRVWVENYNSTFYVSMHLLVLSAFRLEKELGRKPLFYSLNAPSGAQCFPT